MLLVISTVKPLQRAQNAAARLVLQLGTREHVTPALRQLHWLPVHLRVKHKLCTMMHSVHTGQCPAYLSNMVHAVADNPSRPGLRSADTSDYHKPRCHSALGERSFAYAGPLAWNDLPLSIRNIRDRTLFRKHLKTFLFNAAT